MSLVCREAIAPCARALTAKPPWITATTADEGVGAGQAGRR